MRIAIAAALILLAACRGEPVPRDYQNFPPAMNNPADSAQEAPTPQSSTAVAEPSYGVEGTSGPYEPTKPAVAPGHPVGDPTPVTP